MFWDTFADTAAVSGVTAVLNRESFSVEDLLREDDVLQEFATSNTLVSFVAAHVSQMLGHALADPQTDEEARFGFFSTEVLRFGHASVSAALLAPAVSQQLLSFLDRPLPLPAVPAEHFSKVVVALLDSRALSPRHLAAERLLPHLGNASMLNVVLAVVGACTAEFETVKGENCRMIRLLAPDDCSWLAEQQLPLRVSRALVSEDRSERAHALEVLEKLAGFTLPGDAVSQQMASEDVREGVYGSGPPDGRVAQWVEAAEAAVLLQSKFGADCERFAVRFAQQSLIDASVRTVIAAARLMKSRPCAATMSLLPAFVDFMLAHERATLVAIAVTDCVTAFLAHSALRQETRGLVFPRIEAAFHAEQGQLMGLLIALLDAHQELVADEAVRTKVAQCVALQKKPLFGTTDPDRYIAKLDLKGGDIDGIKL